MYRIRHISGWTDIVCNVAPEGVQSHLEAAAKTFKKPIMEFSAIEGVSDPIGQEAVTLKQPAAIDTRSAEQRLLDALRSGDASGIMDSATQRVVIALARAQ